MIKYQCGKCGKIVDTAEAYGRGVFVSEFDDDNMTPHAVQGKSWRFYSPVMGIQIDIVPEMEWEHEFCGECVLGTVHDFLTTFRPDFFCSCEKIKSGELAGALIYNETCLVPEHRVLVRMGDGLEKLDEYKDEEHEEPDEYYEDQESSDTSPDVPDVRAGGEVSDTSTDKPAKTTPSGYPPGTYVHKPDPRNPVRVEWKPEYDYLATISSGCTCSYVWDDPSPVQDSTPIERIPDPACTVHSSR